MIIFNMVTGQCQELNKQPVKIGQSPVSLYAPRPDQPQAGLQEVLIQPDCHTVEKHNAVIITELRKLLQESD